MIKRQASKTDSPSPDADADAPTSFSFQMPGPLDWLHFVTCLSHQTFRQFLNHFIVHLQVIHIRNKQVYSTSSLVHWKKSAPWIPSQK